MERYDIEFLDELEDNLLQQILDILRYALDNANENGKLRNLLKLLHRENMLPQTFENNTYPTGKILVFANPTVKEKELLGIAKDLGISKERFEFYDYKESKTYPYSTLEYNSKISAILVGAVPHSTTGTDDYGSIVTSLEGKANAGIIYACVRRLHANSELKLTKTNFKETLKSLMDEGRIKAA